MDSSTSNACAVAALAPTLDLEELDADGSSIAVLDRESRILWVNEGWKRFAHDNRTQPSGDALELLGTLYLDGMNEPLRSEFAALFEEVLRTNEPFVQSYLCSSPDLHREYRMRILPIERRQLLCEHTLVRSGPASTLGHDDPAELSFRTADGLICMCSNCGRTRRPDGQWQWVPSWVAKLPAATTHALCASCSSYYYGWLRT